MSVVLQWQYVLHAPRVRRSTGPNLATTTVRQRAGPCGHPRHPGAPPAAAEARTAAPEKDP
jgi:hypothetical protein